MNRFYVLSAVVAVSLGASLPLVFSQVTGTPVPKSPPLAAASAPACCGQAMTIVGDAYVYTVAEGKSSDGTAVPAELRTEVFGDQLVARAELPAGTYTVEVVGSENSFSKAGQRVFSVAAYSGDLPAGEGKNPAGVRYEMARDVDLFALAGGQGKAYTIKGTVKHGGGPLRLVFTGSVDNAKFSSIRILDAQGSKSAWLFAADIADLMRDPEAPPAVAGPVVWKDATQSNERRVADLVRRMTLREKISQLMHMAPAIERLGVPSYNYWSEGLHGVARNGLATVFPQAIGMSATWDPAALHAVGDVIATEARAKFNGWQAEGGFDIYGGTYKGLTFWSPNINLFRDPRWGRGHETYGEDPYLTGTMAVAFIKGLQGDDPKYLKTVATAKHFAVHSGPESQRHTFNATPPVRDFYESYLPHFEMAVKEGHVSSIMGAYNRVYGAPACESDLLLKTILRRDWGFQGYVVSDCGAISDIWANHQVEQNRGAAAAGALMAGCDLECGRDFGALALAVELHLVGEGVIDQALGRVLVSRFKLGLFDPPAQVKYAAITLAENDTPAHQALALKMARESMVLLKNDGVLPLQKTAKKIAIVGPNADGLLPLVGNYNGTPSRPVTVVQGLREAFRGQVVHVRGCDNAPRASALPQWQLVPDICLSPAQAQGDAGETGLMAQHFDNEELRGEPVVARVEKQVDFAGLVQWTSAGMPMGASSSRWAGDFVAPADGEFHLIAVGSTNHRLAVNGKVVDDQWGLGDVPENPPSPAASQAATAPASNLMPGEVVLKLKAGQRVPVVLESHQASGAMSLQLYWNRGEMDLTAKVAERVKDADVIIFAGGLDGRMEAEEGDIRGYFEGFDGGDRKTIELPACQSKLLEALAATGKPVVFVNMTGSAVAMPWAAQHVNAIVQAWYPGESGGTAVADVLFGDYNPSGRLPVTFYKATADLPAFTDYAMKGHTYRYFTGAPLWAFGHGLSYTTFRYSATGVDKTQAGAGDSVTVRVDVTNAGRRDGEEVVQVYARPAKAGEGDAVQRLVAFKRVVLAAGQTAHLELAVPVAALRNWDVEKKAYVVPAGTYSLAVGASSADIRGAREVVVK